MGNLLEVKDLRTYFYTDDGVVKAVDGVDFEVKPGETIGIVGESGCGKSITAMSILRLIQSPPGKIVTGEIVFEEEDLVKVSEKRIREIRGNSISMIFQEPMTSLNPVFTAGYQIEEILKLHQNLDDKEAREKAVEMIRMVGIPNPERIADEPTTALDVTIQAQILDLMNELKEKLNTSIMLITHDLGVIAEMADHVIVMYSGKVVEDAPTVELFENPRHPYTIGLMSSIPSLAKEGQRLETIPGAVPNPLYLPKGCYFHPRCKYATKECREIQPELIEIAPGHKSACLRAQEVTR